MLSMQVSYDGKTWLNYAVEVWLAKERAECTAAARLMYESAPNVYPGGIRVLDQWRAPIWSIGAEDTYAVQWRGPECWYSDMESKGMTEDAAETRLLELDAMHNGAREWRVLKETYPKELCKSTRRRGGVIMTKPASARLALVEFPAAL